MDFTWNWTSIRSKFTWIYTGVIRNRSSISIVSTNLCNARFPPENILIFEAIPQCKLGFVGNGRICLGNTFLLSYFISPNLLASCFFFSSLIPVFSFLLPPVLPSFLPVSFLSSFSLLFFLLLSFLPCYLSFFLPPFIPLPATYLSTYLLFYLRMTNDLRTHLGPIYTIPDSHGHDIKFSHIKASLAPNIIIIWSIRKLMSWQSEFDKFERAWYKTGAYCDPNSQWKNKHGSYSCDPCKNNFYHWRWTHLPITGVSRSQSI